MKALRRGLDLVVLALLCLSATILPELSRANPPPSYHIALLHVTYSDTTAIYTLAQLQAAAGEIHDYFDKMSYGKIDVEVTPFEVSLPHTKEYYFDQCQTAPLETRKPCPPPLVKDAADWAASHGFSFNGINGISVLSTFCSGDYAQPAITLEIAGVSRTFGQSHDFECSGPAPGPSGVKWGGWSHEFGHQLEYTTYGAAAFSWGMGGHPSDYASGYDEMDSCYPCDAGAYSLLGPPLVNGSEHVFGGWLNSANVIEVNEPGSGTISKTVELAPLEKKFTTKTNQAIKIPVSPGIYYLVEVRVPIQSDRLQNNGVVPRGIYDSGVHVVQVEEGRDPPVRPVNACDTTVPGGCVYSHSDPRYSSCSPTTRPAYCWPFALWHVGETFTDAGSGIEINVKSNSGDNYSVKVTRSVPAGHPKMYIEPWLTAPMNTYETVDIWVDSSCNGYESDVGPKGLLYGRRANGTVIGNGDDPCANHENRVYAIVRNKGTLAATNAVVHFQVSNPLGVGVTGSWSTIGTVTIPSLAAGDSKTVFVKWTPNVTLMPSTVSAPFAFHSCIQVYIDPVPGETSTANHLAQENFANFYGVQEGSTRSSHRIHGRFFVSLKNHPLKTVYLNTRSALPADWTYEVAGGDEAVTVGPNLPVLEVPASITIPASAPLGQSYELGVQALVLTRMHNEAIPASSKVSHTHTAIEQVGGVVLSARVVLLSAITLSASADSAGTINATGRLNPPEAAVVAIDFTDAEGDVFTRTAHTDANGYYSCSFPTWQGDSTWHVRALWQGDMQHAGALSPRVSLLPPGHPVRPKPEAYGQCGS